MILYNQVGRGTYWRALNLGRGLAAKHHQVTLMAISKKNRFGFSVKANEHQGLTIVESPDLLWGALRSGWDLWDVIARIGWIRGNQFDLVHAFESRPVAIIPALYAKKKKGIPLVLDWCDWFGKGGSVEERPSWLVKTALRPVETFFENNPRTRADGTTVINEFLRQRAINLGVDERTILKLPNGSNTTELKAIPKNEARTELGLSKDIFAIGYIGAIFKKDAILMAEAFDQVRKSEPKSRLIIAGYTNFDIRTISANPNDILITGPITFEDMSLYLSACDICWLPLSDSGANRGRFPLKLNDFMALGKPVVATAVGELGEFVTEYQVGLVASPDPEGIVDQTIRFYQDDQLRKRMAERARRIAVSEFSWNKLSNRLEKFYQKLLDGDLARPS